MSQLIACVLPRGLLFAADRRIAVGEGPTAELHSLRKLFPLGSSAVLATSGAAVGVAVSRFLSRLFAKRSNAFSLGEIESYALWVFQKEYDDFVRQGTEWFRSHPEAKRFSYVMLGGRDSSASFGLRFYASEAHGQPYRLLRTGEVVTAPRRLGLEGRLTRALSSRAELDEVKEIAVDGLRSIAKAESSVGGPFDTALLSDATVRLEEFAE